MKKIIAINLFIRIFFKKLLQLDINLSLIKIFIKVYLQLLKQKL